MLAAGSGKLGPAVNSSRSSMPLLQKTGAFPGHGNGGDKVTLPGDLTPLAEAYDMRRLAPCSSRLETIINGGSPAYALQSGGSRRSAPDCDDDCEPPEEPPEDDGGEDIQVTVVNNNKNDNTNINNNKNENTNINENININNNNLSQTVVVVSSCG